MPRCLQKTESDLGVDLRPVKAHVQHAVLEFDKLVRWATRGDASESSNLMKKPKTGFQLESGVAIYRAWGDPADGRTSATGAGGEVRRCKVTSSA